jgi:DnaJ-class molecular chaperone
MCDKQQECAGHVVKCGTCKGSGIAPGSFGQRQCAACKGAGSVLLK